MLQVSMGALIALVIIMLICFVLPFALFYVLYRYADGKWKTMLMGGAAYIACGVVVDTLIVFGLDFIGGINTNTLVYLLYVVILSPAAFMLINYLVINRFGRNAMKTTGDSMMYSLGYSTAFNILSTGFIAVVYFLTLLDIRGNSDHYLVVSDADYVSASNTVSGSSLVTESIYKEMVRLCSQPVSYYLTFAVNCLWAIAIYAAIMIVISLAVRKKEKLLLLGFTYSMKIVITLPDILNRFNLIKGTWVSYLLMLVILIVTWVAAVFCRKTFIDSEDAADAKKSERK